MTGMLAVTVETKLYVTIGLVVLALYEFWSAMYVYGSKAAGKKGIRFVLRTHRIVGYAFLIYWLWPIIVGLGLLGQLAEATDSWRVGNRPLYMDARVFYHAFLGTTVLLLLLLKVGFVRIWTNFRGQAKMMGIIIVLAALITWIVSGVYWWRCSARRSSSRE